MSNSTPPPIFEYTDYRAYLHERFAWEKSINPRFSLRSLATRIAPSLTSSGLLSGVLKGKKNLGASLRSNFIRALNLKLREGQYFDLLVQFNQASELSERSQLFGKLSRFKNSRAKVIFENQFRFFTQWHHTVVWNYFGVNQKARGASEIAERILPRITVAQVQESIGLLLELGLIKRLANGFAVTEKHLTTEAEFRGLEALPYHQMFLELATVALTTIPSDSRKFGTMVFSASRQTFDQIRERMEVFQGEIQELIDRDEHPEGVFTLGLHLFPNTEV